MDTIVYQVVCSLTLSLKCIHFINHFEVLMSLWWSAVLFRALGKRTIATAICGYWLSTFFAVNFTICYLYNFFFSFFFSRLIIDPMSYKLLFHLIVQWMISILLDICIFILLFEEMNMTVNLENISYWKRNI